MYKVFLAVFRRHRHQYKVPIPTQDRYWVKADPYQPNNDHHRHFALPVLGHLVSISTGLVLELALCSDASFLDDYSLRNSQMALAILKTILLGKVLFKIYDTKQNIRNSYAT
jgi:hypothetical protein